MGLKKESIAFLYNFKFPKHMKLSLFRKTQHKTFYHIPIYYNESEEKIKKIEKNAKTEIDKPKEKNYDETIKGSMHKYDHQHRSGVHFAKSEKKRSNIRIVIILTILFMVAYLLWNYTETFVQAFIER